MKDSIIGWLFGLLRRPKLVVTLILGFVAWTSLKGCMTYVGPNQVGIRQVYFGSDAGIKHGTVEPGLHWVTSGAEKLHLFPTDLQVLDITATPGESSIEHRSTQAIRIQTSEGYAVTVDATILYRIVDPYAVITKVGPGKLYEDSMVIPRSDQILRKTLGELNAEDFYNPVKRIAAVHAATESLSGTLREKGVELVKVLVRRVTYDQAYQQQIEKRKIQDQVVFKNQAEAKAAKGDAHKREIVASGQASVQVQHERGKSDAALVLADADLYARRKAAEADLLVKTAKARGTELENTALKVIGSENMVGLKMAEALGGLQVIVLPSGPGGLNPLDLNATLRYFDVK